jgi:hypothetical protein
MPGYDRESVWPEFDWSDNAADNRSSAEALIQRSVKIRSLFEQRNDGTCSLVVDCFPTNA